MPEKPGKQTNDILEVWSFGSILEYFIITITGGVDMGFRYRKSINLGCAFRINLSKSGVGTAGEFLVIG